MSPVVPIILTIILLGIMFRPFEDLGEVLFRPFWIFPITVVWLLYFMFLALRR